MALVNENIKIWNFVPLFIKKFHELHQQQFFNLGHKVAKNPRNFIIFPFIIALVFATGFQRLIYEKDPTNLYSPNNGHGRFERKIVQSLFPMNYTHNFNPSRVTKISSFVRLLITAKDNQTMFRTAVWNSLNNLDEAIMDLTIEWNEEIYDFNDICARWKSECIERHVLKLNDIIAEIENGTAWVNYPIMLFPILSPLYYGGMEINETEGIVDSVKSVSLTYWLKEGNQGETERSKSFEQRVLKLLNEAEFENITIARCTSKSLEDEISHNVIAILYYFPPTVIILGILTTFSLFMSDWVRSKIHLGVIGMITVGLATGCAFGFLMYCQVPFIGINLAAPFLLLGIGLDDMFVLVSAWNRTSILSEVPERLAQAYREAAVSITITSSTNVLSFFVGTLSPFPAVYYFCIYTGLSVLVTYFFFITFFGGFLALAGYQEQQQKHALTWKVVKAKSETDDKETCYSLCCSGGINKKDPENSKDNQPHLLMIYFKEYFAEILNLTLMKVFIIFVFLVYLAGAIYGCFHMKVGLDYRNMVSDDSYLVNYFNVDENLFRKIPQYRIQVIIHEKITYSDPKTKQKLLDLHSAFENVSYIVPSLYTESWIRRFYGFLDRRPQFQKEVVDEKSFIKILKENFLTPNSPDFLDIVFNENETQIEASRFILQSSEVWKANDESGMMEGVRKIAREAPFKMVTYHPYFLYFEQYPLIKPLTTRTIASVAFVMMVTSFLFIPSLLCTVWVTCSIVSIMVGVMGYMALWGVNLDVVSYTTLIMCIGFSVDFSAHIAYSYFSSEVASPGEKVKDCMFKLGLPIMQSCITTIGGLIIFAVAHSFVYRAFFKVIFLVIIFGTLHATVLLPVMLSLIGPSSCSKNTAIIAEMSKSTKRKDGEELTKATTRTPMDSNSGVYNSSFNCDSVEFKRS